jgi:hypothetical protein
MRKWTILAFLVQKESGTCIIKKFKLFFKPLRLYVSRDFLFWCISLREAPFQKNEFDILYPTKKSMKFMETVQFMTEIVEKGRR